MRVPRFLFPARPPRRRAGFTMIESIIGIALMGIAMLGLAQIFLLGIANNRRAGQISGAVFYAQQRVDYLRSLTALELNTFPSTSRGESFDENLDTNGDGSYEYRRLTRIVKSGLTYTVKVYVFPGLKIGTAAATLIANPSGNLVRALIDTVITR